MPDPNRSRRDVPGERPAGEGSFVVSFADVVERLMQDFDPALPLSVIVGVVREAKADLDGQDRRINADTAAELLERLARARLLDLPA